MGHAPWPWHLQMQHTAKPVSAEGLRQAALLLRQTQAGAGIAVSQLRRLQQTARATYQVGVCVGQGHLPGGGVRGLGPPTRWGHAWVRATYQVGACVG